MLVLGICSCGLQGAGLIHPLQRLLERRVFSYGACATELCLWSAAPKILGLERKREQEEVLRVWRRGRFLPGCTETGTGPRRRNWLSFSFHPVARCGLKCSWGKGSRAPGTQTSRSVKDLVPCRILLGRCIRPRTGCVHGVLVARLCRLNIAKPGPRAPSVARGSSWEGVQDVHRVLLSGGLCFDGNWVTGTKDG